MFELGLARRYLIPKKRGLSVALISLMSVGVISLVVCLVLLFLSITEGIEKKWLAKLTAINAPLRVVPTQHYYNSYYYNIDSISARSDYTLKSFKEKQLSAATDPYNPECDEELPGYWPGDPKKDLIKEAFSALSECGVSRSDAYEISGAMLRLRLMRPTFDILGGDEQRFLTQVSYISSLSEQNPKLEELIAPPTIDDLNQMIYSSGVSDSDLLTDQSDYVAHENREITRAHIERMLTNVSIKTLETLGPGFRLPLAMLPEKTRLEAYLYQGRLSTSRLSEQDKKGLLVKKGDEVFFVCSGRQSLINYSSTIVVSQKLSFSGKLGDGLNWSVTGDLEGIPLKGQVPLGMLQIADAEIYSHFDKEPEVKPTWAYRVGENWHLPDDGSILLPDSFRESGVMLGDTGYLAFGTSTSAKMQEMRLPVRVAGFYDPGIMAIGVKCIMANHNLVHTISSSTHAFSVDPLLSSGIQAWLEPLEQTQTVAQKLREALQKREIDKYFQVIPYQDYPFARDLLMQFQSDKYLFTLIGVIILVVACSNIITLLLLLVNDKKQEIGMLQAMGAKRTSIALIFGLCGSLIGLVSCGIGALLAYFVLINIDHVIGAISALQGHALFNSVFYGDSLPSQMSASALMFTLIATPIIALLAGLVPAVKACRLKPAEILRSGSC